MIKRAVKIKADRKKKVNEKFQKQYGTLVKKSEELKKHVERKEENKVKKQQTW